MSSDRPTIFALSSGRGPAAIAVIRISGSRAGAALEALGVAIPPPRQAKLTRLRDTETGDIIDEALALWFPGPHSETGEDVAELQVHGGQAVIAAVFAVLSRVDGLQPAEAGEFTRRAFENGKLDLTAVEGVADLVSAETEGQRRQAFRQMKGLLGNRAEAWRQRLIQAMALVGAGIDFSDEGDVPNNLVTPALQIAHELGREIETALADGHRGERLRDGIVVAIAGPPNAGKSTLLNRIARREAAIVSPHAGTTRDVIEVHLDLGGLPVTLLDTAGIRETGDAVELEGVRRARARAAGADLVLWVVDASGGSASAGPMAESADALWRGLGSGLGDRAPDVWLVRNKSDLTAKAEGNNEVLSIVSVSSEAGVQLNKPLRDMINEGLSSNSEPLLRTNRPIRNMVTESLMQPYAGRSDNNELEFDISALTGSGFDKLLDKLTGFAATALAGSEQALVTRERHRRALTDVLAALRRAPALAGHEDLLAEELRIAAHALARLTGRIDVEDVLDSIFRDFCIGK
jgi:tRNA modification GTPase